jgi:AraC-like DNA-binding protein/mannose-6-phosphate isomerase-like protein (cupin superfamily)
MVRRRHPPFHERLLAGDDFDLPLVGTLGVVRSHSAVRIPWHQHDDYELLMLLEGATTYEFRPGPTVSLSGGQFLLVPPGRTHRGAHDIRMPVVMCSLMFLPTRRDAWRNSVFPRGELPALNQQLQSAAVAPRACPRELRTVVTRLMDEAEAFHAGHRDAAAQASLRALACQAIVDATRQLTAPAKASPTELVAAAEAYLCQHLAEAVRVADLARHLGLSRARVFELFKTATGLTPNDYLVRQRINRGCQLLAATQQSVTDIALAIGFSSGQYFCNVFRKYTGMRPTDYRHATSDDLVVSDVRGKR